jgi:hypothetical protein
MLKKLKKQQKNPKKDLTGAGILRDARFVGKPDKWLIVPLVDCVALYTCVESFRLLGAAKCPTRIEGNGWSWHRS